MPDPVVTVLSARAEINSPNHSEGVAMVISSWTKDGDTAEVVDASTLDDTGFRAWNVTRGRFAVEGLFATVSEIERALTDAGWVRYEGNFL